MNEFNIQGNLIPKRSIIPEIKTVQFIPENAIKFDKTDINIEAGEDIAAYNFIHVINGVGYKSDLIDKPAHFLALKDTLTGYLIPCLESGIITLGVEILNDLDYFLNSDGTVTTNPPATITDANFIQYLGHSLNDVNFQLKIEKPIYF
jgi:hypothetical protein